MDSEVFNRQDKIRLVVDFILATSAGRINQDEPIIIHQLGNFSFPIDVLLSKKEVEQIISLLVKNNLIRWSDLSEQYGEPTAQIEIIGDLEGLDYSIFAPKSEKVLYKLTYDDTTRDMKINGITLHHCSLGSDSDELLMSALKTTFGDPINYQGSRDVGAVFNDLKMTRPLWSLFFRRTGGVKSQFTFRQNVTADDIKNEGHDVVEIEDVLKRIQEKQKNTKNR